MIRVSFLVTGGLLVVGLAGCAVFPRQQDRPAPKPVMKTEAVPVLPPNTPRTLGFVELETYLNRGKSKDVRIPRAILKRWVRLEKQRENECRVTEEQLQAIKAIDTEKWSNGKSEETDPSR
ncbi:MAG: hypothetical protein A2070_05970 [Bdellovibrionales bacterium GWC1_52_8]|nr:MAG: hypothetical protein A2Z97_08215 [Bdellovibrionales bacterium GWB1_52_6]OFZ03833.1 MAG: hypothetical protein A2X97_15655 [Bdellovibrionales bacterium GWA1_52_35]OFZ39625.1 MAG: hypothetical protein A2070_05970 [Bdellovibrionales bacterium GWC1_52_8]